MVAATESMMERLFVLLDEFGLPEELHRPDATLDELLAAGRLFLYLARSMVESEIDDTFPDDLIEQISTIDDLCHFGELRLEHRRSELSRLQGN
jgi:hypothetical protein